MKIYGTKDVNCFVDNLSTWQYCCSYPPNKTWDYRPYDDVRFLNVYRDYEAPWLPGKFTRHCYYLQDYEWHKNRVKPKACLPILHTTGWRFIRIEKDYPLGFRCAPFPMNLMEVRNKIAKLKAEAMALLQREKAQKALLAACKKAKRLTGR